MKKYISIIALLVTVTINSQEGRITYKASTERYLNSKKEPKGDNLGLFQETKENNRDLKYTLIFSNKESLFYRNKEMKVENGSQNFTEILAGNSVFYFNKHTKITTESKEFFGQNFLITKDKIKWKLLNESKVMAGYNCYKATSTINVEGRNGVKTRKITAWYTTDIPLNFGPKNYNGLPGLVLQLEEGGLFFSVTKIELPTKEKIKIQKPHKGKKVTEKKYKALVKDFVLNRRKYYRKRNN